MPRNVEIKARVTDLTEMERRARTLAAQGPFELAQDDTFFPCPNGRLKLREIAPDHGQLIFYERPDIPGPKLSDHVIVPTPSPDILRTGLGRALGVAGRVRKHRRLYWVQKSIGGTKAVAITPVLRSSLPQRQAARQSRCVRERCRDGTGRHH